MEGALCPENWVWVSEILDFGVPLEAEGSQKLKLEGLFSLKLEDLQGWKLEGVSRSGNQASLMLKVEECLVVERSQSSKAGDHF